MNSLAKTTRTAIAIVVVMAAGLWISVTFVGESWAAQGRYVLTLLSLLLLMVLGAALLVAIGKGIGLLWNKLTEPKDGPAPDNQDPAPPDNSQQ